MIGRTISHYRVIEQLGAGGMGVVYSAEDTRLGRLVALKMLSDDLSKDGLALERFQREARAASALNHPNICTIYEVDAVEGKPFLVMELLEGKTLVGSGRLDNVKLLDLGIEFADALATAHLARIIHRDLKPANLFLTKLGHLKVLDFGLAKLLVEREDSSRVATAMRDLTAGDATLGTVAYMSPEQARGEALDARTDLFSLGAVLYELATGTRAFTGSTTAMVFDAILHKQPVLPKQIRHDLNPALEPIIMKALEKDRDFRYQSAADIRADLKRLKHDSGLTAPARPRKRVAWAVVAAAVLVAIAALLLWRRPSGGTTSSTQNTVAESRASTLAVLPFRLLTSDDQLRFLGTGIADAVITRLSNVDVVRVRPTTAILRFAGHDADLQRAGRELAADYLVAGTLQPAGDRLRAGVQLIRVDDGAAIWGQQFDVARTDLLSLEDSIADRVAVALQPRLNADQRARLARRFTSNPAAYEHYLRGRTAMLLLTKTDTARAVGEFEAAITSDPSYALARAGLANAAALMAIRFASKEEISTWKARAMQQAEEALRLAPDLAEAHEAMAAIYRYGEFDWEKVMDESGRAIALNPDLELAHDYRGAAALHLGLVPLAEREARIAMDIDPQRPVESLRIAGVANLFDGHYAEAVRLLQEVASRTDIGDYYLGLAYFCDGRTADAHQLLSRLGGGETRNSRAAAAWASMLAATGHRDEAARLADRVAHGSLIDHHVAYSLGAAYAQLGKAQEALRWLDQSTRTGFPCYPWFVRDPLLQPLRSDARFSALLERLRVQHAGWVGRWGE